MANVSWYGGAGVHAQSWPINAVNVSMQPFTVSNLKDNPLGYGSVLERYFLGSTGKALPSGITLLVYLEVCWYVCAGA